jgi:ferredoxin
MHVVLVDNGRSERLGMEEFWTSLKCIRCGACMNTCPVYRRSGGLSYGATYSGPIGLIIDPTFNKRKYSNLPFASSLNGSCSNVCPVKINIHEQIYAWRRVLAEQHEVPLAKRAAMKAAGELLSRPAAYRAAIAAADVALAHLPRFVIYNGLNAIVIAHSPIGRYERTARLPEVAFGIDLDGGFGDLGRSRRQRNALDRRLRLEMQHLRARASITGALQDAAAPAADRIGQRRIAERELVVAVGVILVGDREARADGQGRQLIDGVAAGAPVR